MSFNWKEYIERIENDGYEFIWVGKCPNCGGLACQINKIGVLHTKCENNDFHNTGFGGPRVHSWAQAVALEKLSDEERKKYYEEKEREVKMRQDRFKSMLLGEI